MQLLICGGPSGKTWIYGCEETASFDVTEVKEFVTLKEGIPDATFRLEHGGKDLRIKPNLKNGDSIKILLTLLGGKGRRGRRGRNNRRRNRDRGQKAATPTKYDTMNAESLLQSQKTLEIKLERTAKERSYFQLERDQVQQFYHIVHKEVNDTRLHIKNLEAQMELMQQNHRNSIRMYVQKVKHLEYDHKNTINAVSMEMAMLQDEEAKEHASRKDKLKLQKQALQRELRKEQLANESAVKTLQDNQAKEISKLREEFQSNFEDLRDSYVKKMDDLDEDLELQRRMEIHEIEERKNLHINDLVRNHDNAFTKMREYYNAITKDNLDLIRALKEELQELKEQTARHEKRYEEIANENKKLSGPLAKAEAEVEECKRKLSNYEKDKRSLKAAKAHLVTLNDRQTHLSSEYTKLKVTYEELLKDRAKLEYTFKDKVEGVSKLTGKQTKVLSEKVAELKHQFETRKVQFASVLREANLDPVVLNNLTLKLEDILGTKNQQIANVKLEIARVGKAHDDLVRVYEARLPQLGIDPKHLQIETINPPGATTAPSCPPVL